MKPMIIARPHALAIAIAAALLPATAFSQSSNVLQMPSMQVVGSEEDAIARQTGAVVIIDREEIERLQPTSTEDVLRRIPGINVKTEEESAIVSNIGIRGLSASEAKSLVLEDGVPVAPGLFIGNDRYYNPRIQRMEGIEILKGSSSLRYGPSTIGGVINYITKTPDDGVGVSARVGSWNTRQATLEAGGRNSTGNAFGGLVATHARSDGFMDRGYEMTDLMFKAGIAPNENHSLGVKLSWYDNEANISYRGLFLEDYRKGRTYNPAPDDYYLTDRKGIDLNHEWHLSDRATLRTLAYWSELTRDYWRYGVNAGASSAAGRWVYTDAQTGNNRTFERTGLETRLSLDHDLFGWINEAEFGLRLMKEEMDDYRVPSTRAQGRRGSATNYQVDSAESIAGYIQNRIVFTDRLSVTPGLRVESYEQKRQVKLANSLPVNTSATTRNTELLPGIGATFQVIPEAQIYGGVYRAFSPASNGVALDQLTDQKLDGERSVNWELGIRGTAGALRYEVTGFYMDFSNLVVTGNSNPALSQSNAGESRHYGLETSLAFELGHGFSVDGNLTWVPVSEFSQGQFDGNRLPYSPEYLANLGVYYTQGKLAAGFLTHYQGSQFGSENNQKNIGQSTSNANSIWGGEMRAYTVYDLTASYQVTDQFGIEGAIKNLTDKRYITGLRQGIYVGPERSFEVGVNYKF